jgi:hypothetical protein
LLLLLVFVFIGVYWCSCLFVFVFIRVPVTRSTLCGICRLDFDISKLRHFDLFRVTLYHINSPPRSIHEPEYNGTAHSPSPYWRSNRCNRNHSLPLLTDDTFMPAKWKRGFLDEYHQDEEGNLRLYHVCKQGTKCVDANPITNYQPFRRIAGKINGHGNYRDKRESDRRDKDCERHARKEQRHIRSVSSTPNLSDTPTLIYLHVMLASRSLRTPTFRFIRGCF